MSVKSGQAITVLFSTANASTGAAADATGTPTGTLYVNGTADGATVTVTNLATGLYKAAVTLPALSAGDVVSLRAAATVSAVAGEGVIWQEVADTERVSDLNDLSAAQVNAEVDTALADYDAPTNAEMVARTLAAADYFDPAADTVANVTTVGSVTGAVGSVTGAVGSVTGAVGSVTGNVGGNVTGSVGSVAAGGITAASIANDAIDAAALAADVVTELQAGLATAVALADVKLDTGTMIPNSLATRASQASVDTIDNFLDTEITDIKAKTDLIPAAPAAVGSAMTLSAGAVSAAAIATGAIDADAIAADAGTEIAAAVWDRLLTGATHNIVNSAGRRLRQLGDTITGTVVDVTPGATTFDTSLAGYVDDHFNDQLLRFTTGNLTGQAKSILSFVGVNGVITVDEGFTEAPANGDAFDILPAHIHPISQIQAGLATSAALGDVPTNAELAAALASADDAILAAIAALNNVSTANILAMAYEGAETFQDFMRLARAALVGKATGGGTANIAFRDAADTKDRIAATVDADGNRSAVVTDAS